MEEINKRLVEVECILRMLDNKYITKVPQEVWNYIDENKDKNYIFKYDNNKSLNEQNLNIDTISILTYINIEYLLEDDEKRELLTLLKNDEIIAEQDKRKKYNPDNLFNNKKVQSKEEVSLVEIKIEKWYEKLFSFLKNMFKK